MWPYQKEGVEALNVGAFQIVMGQCKQGEFLCESPPIRSKLFFHSIYECQNQFWINYVVLYLEFLQYKDETQQADNSSSDLVHEHNITYLFVK